MEHLLKAMISPDPTARISALQTYHHPALQPQAPSIITTPHFVRTAASFIEDEPLPGPLRAKAREAEKKAAADAKRKPRSKKREPKPEIGSSVLGERHTNQKIESRDEGPLDGTSGRVVAKPRKPQPAAEPSTREIRRAIAAAAAEKENQDETRECADAVSFSNVY
jgi:protein-serine/threonine kinase